MSQMQKNIVSCVDHCVNVKATRNSVGQGNSEVKEFQGRSGRISELVLIRKMWNSQTILGNGLAIVM